MKPRQIIGDMEIIGEPSPDFLRALAVISLGLDRELARDFRSYKTHCVLRALTVRDFLRGVGIQARVEPVSVMMRAEDGDGRILHNLTIGRPGDRDLPGAWNGHLVVVAGHWLIDPTLAPVKRPAWAHLRGMLAKPLGGEHGDLARLVIYRDNYLFGALWRRNPKNTRWRKGPDARPERRAGAVSRLVLCHRITPERFAYTVAEKAGEAFRIGV